MKTDKSKYQKERKKKVLKREGLSKERKKEKWWGNMKTDKCKYQKEIKIKKIVLKREGLSKVREKEI